MRAIQLERKTVNEIIYRDEYARGYLDKITSEFKEIIKTGFLISEGLRDLSPEEIVIACRELHNEGISIDGILPQYFNEQELRSIQNQIFRDMQSYALTNKISFVEEFLDLRKTKKVKL